MLMPATDSVALLHISGILIGSCVLIVFSQQAPDVDRVAASHVPADSTGFFVATERSTERWQV